MGVDVIKPKLLQAAKTSHWPMVFPMCRVRGDQLSELWFHSASLNGLEGAYSQILINNRAVFSALNSIMD